MPIMGGGGGVGPASFLPMPMENTLCNSGNIYADILIFANANVAQNFCENSRRRVPLPSHQMLTLDYTEGRMLTKMEKEESFTIINADILIFANFCQCCLMEKEK